MEKKEGKEENGKKEGVNEVEAQFLLFALTSFLGKLQ